MTHHSTERSASEPQVDPRVASALARVNARAWGVATGLLFAMSLFLATNILVLKGGPVVGPHLGLIGVYLPGYSVTFVGSLVGFVYAFVIGYAFGRLIAGIYNTVAHR